MVLFSEILLEADLTSLAAPVPSSLEIAAAAAPLAAPVGPALGTIQSSFPQSGTAPSPIAVFFSGPPIARKPPSNRVKHARKSANSVIAGTIAGATEICITYPIDYMKIQLQLDARSTTPRYKSMADVIIQTWRSHGFRGLYRGLNVAVLSPKAVVRFGAFEQLKKLHQDAKGNLSPLATFFCGMGAGAFEAIFAVTPIESIKIKFIHDLNFATQKYQGLFHGVRSIVKQQGFRGIYQGAVPTVMKTSTNQAIRFFVVESLKDWNKKGDPKAKVNKGLTAVFGAFGGIVSVLCNTPLDVLKSRMQGLEAHKYRNIVHCAYQIGRKEGPYAFYKGILPRLMRVPLETAITFTVYDLIMELLHEHVWEHT